MNKHCRVFILSSLIACSIVKLNSCGVCCLPNIDNIKFENFKKLDGDDKKKALEIIDKLGDTEKKNGFEGRIAVFKSTVLCEKGDIYIFILTEDILKSQHANNLENTKIYVIAGIYYTSKTNFKGSEFLPNKFRHFEPVEYNIERVDVSKGKYKFDLIDSSNV